MTLFLSEKDVEGLLVMKEVVAAVEEAFRHQASGDAVNSPRTRSRAGRSVLNVMHASLPYLGRAGLKCYQSSPVGTKFVVVLFDAADSTPLAVMGADMLGRFRTGAASAVATKHLQRTRNLALGVAGSGGQALTQVLALAEVASLTGVRVWSPTKAHRDGFAEKLAGFGFEARPFDTVAEALKGADIASSITSSKAPFLTAESLADVSHLNLAGGNRPDRAEATPGAIGSFDLVAVDDLGQARQEYADLLRAEESGDFSWEKAVGLSDVVAGKLSPRGRTLFKSGGVAIEDVAVASLVYDKALKSGSFSNSRVELS